jgi:hypothetical protein
MNLIATHNSGTGEPSKNILYSLLIPFARTQSKTLRDQVLSGCSYFDLRIKYDGYMDIGRFRICHGLWKSKLTFKDALNSIYFALNGIDSVNLMVTYEGKFPEFITESLFIEDVQNFVSSYISSYEGYVFGTFNITSINVKKPIWHSIYQENTNLKYIQGYKNLDGSSWHTYLPIPWLWDKIYGNHNFSEIIYIFVDFL